MKLPKGLFLVFFGLSLAIIGMEKQLPEEKKEAPQEITKVAGKKRKLLEEESEESTKEPKFSWEREEKKSLPKEEKDLIEPNAAELSAFEQLPDELKELIVSFLVSEDKGETALEDLFLAAQNIRNLMFSNKNLFNFVNDYNLQAFLIKELARYYDANLIIAAIALGTKNAHEWLQKYLHNNYSHSESSSNESKEDISSLMGKYLEKLAEEGFPRPLNFIITFIKKDKDKYLKRALIKAINFEHEQTTKKLLELGAPVNFNLYIGSIGDWSPLLLAIDRRNLTLVQLLVNHGVALADPREVDDPFIQAVKDDDSQEGMDIVRFLLNTGKISPRQKNKALRIAINPRFNLYDQPHIISILLHAGALFNVKDLLKLIEYIEKRIESDNSSILTELENHIIDALFTAGVLDTKWVSRILKSLESETTTGLVAHLVKEKLYFNRIGSTIYSNEND